LGADEGVDHLAGRIEQAVEADLAVFAEGAGGAAEPGAGAIERGADGLRADGLLQFGGAELAGVELQAHEGMAIGAALGDGGVLGAGHEPGGGDGVGGGGGLGRVNLTGAAGLQEAEGAGGGQPEPWRGAGEALAEGGGQHGGRNSLV
jgi:hypothetical protein